MVQGDRPMGKSINSVNGRKQDSTEKSRKGINSAAAKQDKVETGRKQRLAVLCLQQKLEAAKKAPKPQKAGEATVAYYVGIDLGDKKSYYCFLNADGNMVEGSLTTTPTDFGLHFKTIPRSRIAIEVGTHSPWVSSLLEGIGHEVYVANPRKTEGGKRKNRRKNDRLDAEILARQVKSDPKLLYPIRHRGEKARHALVLLRARNAVVNARTKLICGARGLVKSSGHRLPSCSADSFHKMNRTHVPEELRGMLEPLFEQIGTLTTHVKKYDKEVERMCKEAYPETALLAQPKGVGKVTSLAYLLTIEDPRRFAKSREVGPYIGLVPKQYDSGDSRPQMRITKTGDRMLRQLLVQSAHYIIGPFGEDSDLRRHGLKIAARGGKNAKKRATVAVARKLAVLLHRLWVTAEEYEPLRNSAPKEKVA
jgi:transposase